ncbi:hypothetical protein LU632_26225 (plasmid) [Erwinia tracheiphila]|uniref:hypothetical protein n=1 Tax=Erwinia tracheiphila TaxID=65700 RepID=UPI001F3981C3|nr:hypothetical protein [Erwinia tracheiphila]UIA94557.1 hypothetical protein LU632_26225 [Erwinia tracheiphila]
MSLYGPADSRDGVPELVQAMLHGGIVCFAFKNSDKQSVIDFMVSEDNRFDSQWLDE